MELQLRDYQIEAVNQLRDGLRNGHKSQILVLPTGSGKTLCAAEIIRNAVLKSSRVSFIADRVNLVDQTSMRLSEVNIEHGVTMGTPTFGRHLPVQVCSAQTLERRDFIKDADLIIFDEAHSARAKTLKMVRAMQVPFIGLTATPFSKGLNEIYSRVVTGTTTNGLIKDNWLVPLKVYCGTEIDMTGAKTVAGEWTAQEVEDRAIPIIGDVVSEWVKYTNLIYGGPVKTLVFSASVDHGAELCRNFMESTGHTFEQVSYKDGSTSDIRRKKIDAFRLGQIMGLVSVEALCLSTDTEILTEDGWKTKENIIITDKVAQFNPTNSEIIFAEPKKIIKRKLENGERWVYYPGRQKFKVTGNHRMLVKTGENWKVKKAIDIVGKKYWFPINGYAKPLTVSLPPENKLKSDFDRRVVANSYHLRKNGYSKKEAKLLAVTRILERDSLKYKKPDSLTNDECMFIGFYIGDGSKNISKRCGRSYVLSQSKKNSHIVKWVDQLLIRLAFDCHREVIPKKGNMSTDAIRWRISRGTGYGNQKRKGVYSLEPYMNKSGTKLFMGLNNDQFRSLVYGFWMADGDHGKWTSYAYRIFNTNKSLMDWIQSVAVTRGWRAALRVARQAKGEHNKLYSMTLREHVNKIMIGRDKNISNEISREGDEAWCVETNAGYIVTRREGQVTIMGNSKGFDVPDALCLVVARPYRKSLSGHIQMLGRIMRPAPGKSFGLVLDHASNFIRFAAPTEYFFEHGIRDLDHTKIEELKDKKFENKQRKCFACGFVMAKEDYACPECGHKPERRSNSGPKFVSGTLSKYTDLVSDIDIWPHLCGIANERNPDNQEKAWKFACAQYKSIVGKWPKKGRRLESVDYIDTRVRQAVQERIKAYIRKKISDEKKLKRESINA